MFPLQDRQQKGYKFGQQTFYGVAHKGTDYKANYDSFFIPFPGNVSTFKDFGGGNWLQLTRPNGDVIQLAHLSQYAGAAGFRRAGDYGGVTGNTGALTTNPHLHTQVKVGGKLVDPETYNWSPEPSYPIQLRTMLLFNTPREWPSLLSKMAKLQDWFWTHSNGRIQLVIDYRLTNLKNWETMFYGLTPRVEAISEPWYEKNVLPLVPDADIVLLTIPRSQWTGQVFDDPTSSEYGYCHSLKHPIKAMAFCDENTPSPYYPEMDGFVDIARHEIVHGLYGLGQVYGVDNCHQHYFSRSFEDVFNEIDYSLLALNLGK